MTTAERKPLGQLLLNRGMVKPEHLERALEAQRLSNHQKLLGEVLVELQLCSEEQITEALAEAYEVPFARVGPKLVDPQVLSILPRDFLEKHAVVPLFLVEGVLTIALAEPANLFLIEEIERLAGYPAQIVAATSRDIRSTLDAYLPESGGFVVDAIEDGGDGVEIAPSPRPPANRGDLASAANQPPVIKLVNLCIHSAVKDRASEIHIEPGENALRVRHRIDGRMVEKRRPPLAMHAAIAARIKTLAGLDAGQRQVPQAGSFHATVDARPVELHVTTVRQSSARRSSSQLWIRKRRRSALRNSGSDTTPSSSGVNF